MGGPYPVSGVDPGNETIPPQFPLTYLILARYHGVILALMAYSRNSLDK